MKRVLLTGGTGFVGRHLRTSLVSRGAEVVLVTRPGSCLEDWSGPTVETQDAFAETDDFWTRVLQDVDVVLHAAWYCAHGRYLEAPENLTCLQGSLNLACAARAAGIQKFVGIGTCFEYLLEEKPLSISQPLMPNTLYGATKAGLFLALKEWFKDCETEFAWCRLFYLHGDGEDLSRLFPMLHDHFRHGHVLEFGSGKAVRDYLPVEEAAEQIAQVCLGTQAGALNVCSGKGRTLAEIAMKIAQGYGHPELLRLGVHQDRLADPPMVLGVPNVISTSSSR